jgi:CRISPR system Cascade subunit CasA
MPFNLITDPWLPVRRLNGPREWIAPAQITSDFKNNPILALDFPRPDWNAAVTELLIGLLAMVAPPFDTSDWAELWAEPLSPDELAEKLTGIAFAFNLDGDGPRCLQDIDPLADSDEKPISALLIDAPGENAEKKNTDLFVKRAPAQGLCPAYAAAALVTLQTYAPAGGQGNRTSMRGGGPLTTLPLPRRKVAGQPAPITTLWDVVWASVPVLAPKDQPPADPDDPDWSLVFPWLARTRTSDGNKGTLPDDGHMLQQFFGMPRRIRLDFSASGDDCCTLEGPASETLVRSFRQKNYGVKYDGWTHTLSPHRADPKAGLLPFHPQPGGATYRDWLTWVETPPEKTTQRAIVLDWWGERLKVLRAYKDYGEEFDAAETWQSSILACGFDMDNMKARAWLEARIPYFDPPPDRNADDWSMHFRRLAALLVAGADEAAGTLRSQIKIALTGRPNREGRYRADENLPRDAFAELIERFWRETEIDFSEALKALRGTPDDPESSVRERFMLALRRKALLMFDDIASTDDLADQDARRIVEARATLQYAFNDTGSVRNALDLMTEEAKQKASRRRTARKAKDTGKEGVAT